MIEIDCAAIHARELEQRKKAPPLLEVTFDDKTAPVDPSPAPWHGGAPAGEAYDLWQEMIRVKKERDMLSTRTAHVVHDTVEALRKESSPAVDAFMTGDLPVPAVAAHYQAIQALTDQAIALYDRITHVEKYGVIERPMENASDDRVDALQRKIRRLDDAIYKTKKKLDRGVAKNPARMGVWREKLALDEAKRDDLKAQVKRLQYEARGKRAGEG